MTNLEFWVGTNLEFRMCIRQTGVCGRGVFVSQVNKLRCGLAFRLELLLSTPVLDASAAVHHIQCDGAHGNTSLVEEIFRCYLLEDLEVDLKCSSRGWKRLKFLLVAMCFLVAESNMEARL